MKFAIRFKNVKEKKLFLIALSSAAVFCIVVASLSFILTQPVRQDPNMPLMIDENASKGDPSQPGPADCITC